MLCFCLINILYPLMSFRQSENFSSDFWMAFWPRFFPLECGLPWMAKLQTVLSNLVAHSHLRGRHWNSGEFCVHTWACWWWFQWRGVSWGAYYFIRGLPNVNIYRTFGGITFPKKNLPPGRITPDELIPWSQVGDGSRDNTECSVFHRTLGLVRAGTSSSLWLHSAEIW